MSRDVTNGTAFIAEAAAVLAAASEADRALDRVELLLRMPAGREMSVPLLRVEPDWDPLRRDPRFQRLLQMFAPAKR